MSSRRWGSCEGWLLGGGEADVMDFSGGGALWWPQGS
jgi:hypothetical protein